MKFLLAGDSGILNSRSPNHGYPDGPGISVAASSCTGVGRSSSRGRLPLASVSIPGVAMSHPTTSVMPIYAARWTGVMRSNVPS